MKKYAFMLMNPSLDVKDAHVDAQGIKYHFIHVKSEKEALKKARELADDGFGVIEVCGAFGQELAQCMYEETNKRVPVGYVIYPQDQEIALNLFWQSACVKESEK